jgi:hypothetical protein
MVWLEVLLLLLATGLAATALRQCLSFERSLTDSADTLRRSGVLLLETQRQWQQQRQIDSAQRLTEATIDTGAATVRAVHLGIAAIPFGILEAIPVTRDASKVVRRTHDLISEAVYGSIRGVNKAVGEVARSALKSPPPEESKD